MHWFRRIGCLIHVEIIVREEMPFDGVMVNTGLAHHFAKIGPLWEMSISGVADTLYLPFCITLFEP